ncbi:uncharacterized protein [Drosophila kikkawai]|uniref:HAT C-terminal dimerisation domain-containing protein n=1 Tax=Drosophila kikkawai TaxID=30033 RepID=A0ABM4GFR9_DROKI
MLLKEDFGDAKFSLLLDESTDISVCKTLGVAINYFSSARSVMVSTFLSLIPLEEGDSKTIVNSLCQELSSFKLNLANLIGIGTDNASVMLNCNLGYAFEKKLKEVSENISNEAEIRLKCVNFIVSLINELKQRLPDNIEILQQIDVFSVEKILCPKKAEIVHILEHFKLDSDTIEEILFQYNNVHLIRWTNVMETTSFWAEVYNYVDAAGNKRFSAQASFVLSLFSLPWSNAEVERVFSQMNNVKTKLRNRMGVQTLNSILHIRYGLH